MDAKNAPVRAKARARPRREDVEDFVAADARADTRPGHIPVDRNRAPRVFTDADRAAVVGMLWESAERQVADLHVRVLSTGLDADERERDGRTLSVMVKTMRELAALDETTVATHDDRNPEADSRDIDEFRRELARRIDALVAAQPDETDGGDAGA
jgi:hypothetical protein